MRATSALRYLGVGGTGYAEEAGQIKAKYYWWLRAREWVLKQAIIKNLFSLVRELLSGGTDKKNPRCCAPIDQSLPTK